MSTAAMTNRLELSSIADTALKAAARFWFAVTFAGQLVFAFAVASFYSLTALRGDYHGWSRFISRGHVAGDTVGNSALAAHVTSAAIVMFAGSLQLIPQIRNRFPVFHRWNGRIYLSVAVVASAAGLYLTWIRGTVGDLSQHIGSSLGAVLIFLFAALALRSALTRDFIAHRRWALRLFLVVSGAFFIRLVLVLTGVMFKGPVGFNPQTFTGPFLTFLTFGQYLIPLAVLEIYLRAQDRPSARNRFAAAGLLFVMTLVMIGGIVAVTLTTWTPQVRAAYNPRKSIAETLSATIDSSGIDQAAQQYHDLKAAHPATYDFDETELNTLGYDFIRAKKFKEAVRILQLNVEAYPKSSNVYDSLGEAYMDDGNKPLAIVNYQKSLQLNPKNHGAVEALQKLNAP
jgi:tetratricopeptide (TPR) repeat protein